MVYYRIGVSKRGRKCRGCGSQIVAGDKHFVYFQFEKGKMQYPLNENFCLECAKNVASDDFFYYVSQLRLALVKLRQGVNSLTK